MQFIDEGKIPLRPGVLRLVDEAIANGVQLAVCSTSNEKAVSNLVSTLMGEERASKFKVFAGDMVKKKKPAPDVYLMAVDEMKLDKDRCVIIEDSHIGVGAAVAAGISCLVTKSSYTADEDFTGAKMIVEELGDDGTTGITLETLECLLGDDVEECAIPAWDRVGHVEKTGASWTGARLGDDLLNKPPGTAQKIGAGRGIGVKMEAHVEKGGASWTGARFGEENIDKVPGSVASSGSRSRGIGVQMEAHVEKGGASWTGARFGEENVDKPPGTVASSGSGRGIGVPMRSHIESGGRSWTGARFGDDNPNKPHAYTPSETYEFKTKDKTPGSKWDVGSHTEVSAGDVDKWSGARFGDVDVKKCGATPSQWHE